MWMDWNREEKNKGKLDETSFDLLVMNSSIGLNTYHEDHGKNINLAKT
jgi:hypothetical protein